MVRKKVSLVKVYLGGWTTPRPKRIPKGKKISLSKEVKAYIKKKKKKDTEVNKPTKYVHKPVSAKEFI